MNIKNLVAFVFVLLIFAGCKKSTDNASKWVGTYNVIPGSNSNSAVNQVKIEESNSFTLRMFFNNVANNTVTYVTFQHVNLPTADSAAIAENDSTVGVYSIPTYTGSALLSGDTLKVLCTATDSTHYIPFNFYGTKQ